jgi:D-glycero-D-manno-heptose 1,7-bisphosphate phosphatase
VAIKAVFLDRDGTLIRHVHYLHEPEKVEILPGVRETLAQLLKQGVKLFLFTNQSGVARGFYTLDDVQAVNQRMVELIGLGENIFTDICIATEMPSDAPVYRKPSPRFILESLAKYGIPRENAVMIGDNPTDWEAGHRAGLQVVAIRSSATESEGAHRWTSRHNPYRLFGGWTEIYSAMKDDKLP